MQEPEPQTQGEELTSFPLPRLSLSVRLDNSLVRGNER